VRKDVEGQGVGLPADDGQGLVDRVDREDGENRAFSGCFRVLKGWVRWSLWFSVLCGGVVGRGRMGWNAAPLCRHVYINDQT
jgi:hypothetical protein